VFHCRNPYWDCNRQGDADHVAAMNIKSRIEDRAINQFTPHKEVKKILDERFLRRMESRRTTAYGRTPSEPQSLTTTVGDINSVERKS
jgi:hypothetical protein